ncbi:helix-turn-helix domain-containing protein [Paenibacillus segetis]|uniref:HTH cro/C1-type domain-containing protein n=1 Tax=Paenibacillus segetis TaxID=1325360 RepID=A0ABQ1Y5I6_9BACL|nr:helix-turn-helix transcriptional regulator [Paenibacillus segetis]GGH13168.1 hypothetical protein GCM10008013_06050 [Paenibacillus segetis]
MTIYERIELLIKNMGITKKKFCAELGISTGNFGDWKRGKSTPSSNKLIDISQYFNVSLDWLMTGRERRSEQIDDHLEAYLAHISSQKCSFKLSAHEVAFIREYIQFSQYRRKLKLMSEGGNNTALHLDSTEL